MIAITLTLQLKAAGLNVRTKVQPGLAWVYTLCCTKLIMELHTDDIFLLKKLAPTVGNKHDIAVYYADALSHVAMTVHTHLSRTTRGHSSSATNRGRYRMK